MKTRKQVLAVAVVVALASASCSWIFGDDDTDTTSARVTTAEPEAEQASFLTGGSNPPPGLEAQIRQTVSAVVACSGSLNGPGAQGVYEIPPTALARLMMGDLLYDTFAIQLETDPGLASRLADVVPLVESHAVAPQVSPGSVVTIDPGILEFIASEDSTGSVETLDQEVFLLPGLTVAPQATPTTVPPPPPAVIEAVRQTDRAFFCGSGWNPNGFLQVTITDPSGEVLVDRFDQAGDSGSAGISWTPGLEHSVGRYSVTLSDGSFTAEADFDVEAPSTPTIDVLGTEVAQPGDAVKIGLVAFSPGAEVDLHVFAEDDFEGWRYTGTARGVRVSEVGSTVFELQTLPDDPEGIYCVLLDGDLLFQCRDAAFEVAAG